MSALSPRQMFELDLACKPIDEAFGGAVYLVGTAAEGRQSYRDVDVRVILGDEEYDALAAAITGELIAFLGIAIGRYLAASTGLPIDFQIQRMTEANDRHDGVRNPLGTRGLDHFRGDAAPTAPVPIPATRWIRDPACVERWPEAESFAYDPRCCRFPKSCSATIPSAIPEGDDR